MLYSLAENSVPYRSYPRWKALELARAVTKPDPTDRCMRARHSCMNALNQAVLRSQTEISLHAVTANRIVLAGPPRTRFINSSAATAAGLRRLMGEYGGIETDQQQAAN